MEVKRCPRCGETKPKEQFARNRSSRDGLGSYCLSCHRVIVSENKERIHGGQRNYLFKYRYGIDLKEFERLVLEQDGKCAICGKRPAKQVDHCHESGKVRQILCFYGNRGLGKFKDSTIRMHEAIQYLSGSKMP